MKTFTPKNPRLSSNVALSKLRHIFIFSQMPGDSCLESQVVGGVLQDVAGAYLDQIIGKYPLDIISNSNIGVEIISKGIVPESAIDAIKNINPDIGKGIDKQTLNVCIRPMTDPMVNDSFAFFLIYNK